MADGAPAGLTVARTVEAFLPAVTGPATQAWELSRELEGLGVRSPVFCSRLDAPAAAAAEERIGAVRVRRLEGRILFGRYVWTPGLAACLEGADLVHCHNLRNAQTDLAWRFCRDSGVPLVVHAHGGLLGWTRYRMPAPARWAYRAYDALVLARVLETARAVVVSGALERRDALAAGVPERKLAVVRPGVRAPEGIPTRGRDGGTLRLLSVGRLCALRRPEALIEAVALLPGSRLTLVGSPARMSVLERPVSLEGLGALARRLGVADRVALPGSLGGEALERAYAEADLFVCASGYESFGLPLLEAAARGLPLVTTRVGVAEEIVREGETGRFTDGTPEDLAAQAKALAAAGPWAAAARWAVEGVRPAYSWPAAAAACVRLYGGILGR